MGAPSDGAARGVIILSRADPSGQAIFMSTQVTDAARSLPASPGVMINVSVTDGVSGIPSTAVRHRMPVDRPGSSSWGALYPAA